MVNRFLSTHNKKAFTELLLNLSKDELLSLKLPLEVKLAEIREAIKLDYSDKLLDSKRSNLISSLRLIDAYNNEKITNYAYRLHYEEDKIIDKICLLNPIWLVPSLLKYDEPNIVWNREGGFNHFYPFIERGVIERPFDNESYLIGIDFICYNPQRKNAQVISNEILADPGLITKDYPCWVSLNAQKSEINEYFSKIINNLVIKHSFEKKPLIEAYLKAILVARNEKVVRQLINALVDIKINAEDHLDFLSTCFSILGLPSASAGKYVFQVMVELLDHPKFKVKSFLQEIPVTILTKSNPYLIQQLKLIEEIVNKQPKSTIDYLTIIPPIFLNTNTKVQELTAKIINSLPKKYHSGISESIMPYFSTMTGSTKKLLGKWIDQDPYEKSDDDIETQKREPSFNLENDTYSLAVGEPLTTCETVEDLGFAAAAILSKKGSPKQFDVFLDGIYKFAHTEKDKLIKIFKKQSKSAEKYYLGSHDWGYYPWTSRITAEVILRIIGAKLDDRVCPFSDHHEIESNFFSIIVGRVKEILCSEEQHSVLPLLATPETELGFIEPQTLVDRLKCWSDAGVEVLHYDFLQAIARCNIHSSQALPIVTAGPEVESNSVLRFLLTGEITSACNTIAWWQCAARTREPLAHFSHLTHPFILSDQPLLPDWQEPYIVPIIVTDKIIQIIEYRRILNESPADWLYPRMALKLGDITQADIYTYFSVAPNSLDLAINNVNTYIREKRVETPFQRTTAAFYLEIISRQLPMHYSKANLMILGMGNKHLHALTIDLWIQAEELCQVKPNIERLGDVLGKLIIDNAHTINAHEDYTKYFDLCPLVIALPCIREVIALGYPFDEYMSYIIRQALKKQLVNPVTGLAKLLEIYYDLLITYPSNTQMDLNEYWDQPLTGSLKTIANKISQA